LGSYLTNFEAAFTSLVNSLPEKLVDILQLFDYLGFDFTSSAGQKLQIELAGSVDSQAFT
jgi:hypothetical protein